MRHLLLALALAFSSLLFGCSSSGIPPSDAAVSDSGEDAAVGDAGLDAGAADAGGADRFASGALASHLNGGYVDSHFLSHDGNRLYFMYTPWGPLNLMTGVAPDTNCPAGEDLVGHSTASGLEWNTDLYFVEWDGGAWSAPQNLGSNINTLGMECCVWVSDDETELIFLRTTDYDGDGVGGDLGLPLSGNYRSTRATKNDSWGPALVMPGRYGPAGQGKTDAGVDFQVSDLHQTPSKNLYGWETTDAGEDLLLFGRWNGTGHDPPERIPGSVDEDAQIWVSNDELLMFYNHRDPAANTTLRRMTRSSVTAPWGAPSTVPTTGFADATGVALWGEPTFTADGSAILVIRFNQANPVCWRSEIIRARGGFSTGYSLPNTVN